MRNKFIAATATGVVVVACWLSSAPVSANADPPVRTQLAKSAAPGEPAAAQGQQKPGKVLYCLMTEVSGSRIRTKLCLTRAQWEQRGVDVTEK